MRGKQLAMDSALADLDRYELERERQETDKIKSWLDSKYQRIYNRKNMAEQYPAGSVVIIGQNLFRNGHYKLHFYRTVLNYYSTNLHKDEAVFVEATDNEFPERPPWAETVGHEGELKDIHFYPEHIHWATGEIVEPIKTWWMKAYFE